MNGVLGDISAHIGCTGPRETPEDDEMNEMTLPSDTGFEIWALAVWGRGRYLSVTEALQNNKSSQVSGEETFCFFETWRPEWGSNPRSPTFQEGSFNHCTTAPASSYNHYMYLNINICI